jgi:hypothetical protein
LCASRCSTQEQPVTGLITIGRGHEPDVGLARVCSALANTQTANSVELILGFSRTHPAIRAWIWRWVAFALFSDYALHRSSITSVKLSRAFITETDVDAIADVMSSPYPMGMLARGEPGVLKRGAWVKLLPIGNHELFPPDSCSWILSHDIHGVNVVDTVVSSPELVHAIVPGYGMCQVRLVDVIPDADAPRSSGPVTKLKLAYSGAAEIEGAPERFLELVGAPLTSLHLSTWSDAWIPITAVVRCCPRLKHLRVDDGIFDTGAFLEAYRNSDMHIEEITLEVDVESVPILAAELSDGETRLAKNLKRLDCTWEDMDPPPEPIELNCIADMLERNRTLEYVRVQFCYDMDEELSVEVLERFDHELLPFASEPFPLRCRLAFLSIFSPHRRVGRDVKRRTRSPRETKLLPLAMDRLVLSLIFEFAAKNAVRHVQVTRQY